MNLKTNYRKSSPEPPKILSGSILRNAAFDGVNLTRFPYHLLYEVQANAVRVMVVRHNKRNPDYGLDPL